MLGWNLLLVMEYVKGVLCIKVLGNISTSRYYRIVFALLANTMILGYGGLERQTSKSLVVYFITYMLLFNVMKGEKKVKIIQVLWVIFIVGCIDEAVLIVMNLCPDITGVFAGIEKKKILEDSISAIVLLIILIIKNKVSVKKIHDVLEKNFFLVLVLIGMMGLISCVAIDQLRQAMPAGRTKVVFTVVSLEVIVSLFLMAFLALFINYVNDKLRGVMESEKKLKYIELNYYEQLLKKEEDTRKYRHDIMNHYICLKEYLRIGEYEKANDYLERLQTGLKEIQRFKMFSPNRTVDAIVNYYYGVVSESVEVRCDIKCHKEIGIEDMDLCIVLGNVLQNAVEAVQRQIDGNKWISIIIKQGEAYLEIRVINSRNSMEYMSNNIWKKENAKNHGFGLKNVREVVEKYNGNIKVRKCEQEWEVCVCIPYSKEAV